MSAKRDWHEEILPKPKGMTEKLWVTLEEIAWDMYPNDTTYSMGESYDGNEYHRQACLKGLARGVLLSKK